MADKVKWGKKFSPHKQDVITNIATFVEFIDTLGITLGKCNVLL
jgi:hypothetical protein